MKSIIKYLVALTLAVAASSTFAKEEATVHNILIYGKEAKVTVSIAPKALAAKVLAGVKKEMETVLADAQSARYTIDSDGDMMLDVENADGTPKFVIHTGIQVNAKNAYNAYTGYNRMCVFTTRNGEVALIGVGENELMEVCALYIKLVSESI